MEKKEKVLTWYDATVDMVYVQFNHACVDRTVEVEDGVLIDLDKNGKIVGCEVLNPLFHVSSLLKLCERKIRESSNSRRRQRHKA